MKTKNLFLTISLVTFAVGFFGKEESIINYMGLPVGAIFFMLFMVFTTLEKESALLDEQRKESAEIIEKHLRSRGPAASKTSDQENCAPVLTTASSQ
jgi:hypothetical protein